MLLVIISCAPKPSPVVEQGRGETVRAFLFDAELRRAGKPTSFRLEIFQADTIMALSGRGYLGKGALRGKATADSLVCYFPASNEYIDEPVLALMHALDCKIAPAGVNLVTLLSLPPDSASLDSSITIVSNYEDIKRPRFIVYIQDCAWQMELAYRHEKLQQWRLDEFVFFDGKDTRLKASCREFKDQVSLKPGRFDVPIPSDAQRIIP